MRSGQHIIHDIRKRVEIGDETDARPDLRETSGFNFLFKLDIKKFICFSVCIASEYRTLIYYDGRFEKKITILVNML